MKAVLIPQTVFVGDAAQFLVPLSDQEAYTLKTHNITPEKSIPCDSIAENKTMTIQDVRITVRDNRQYLLISFIPWETGTVYFPSFSFLYIERELPAITVASILETNDTYRLQPAKQPLIMPGTDYLLYSAAGIVFAGSVLSITVLLYLYRFLKKRRGGLYAKKRRKYLKKNMKKLQKTARKIEKKRRKTAKSDEVHQSLNEWFANLDGILRQYFFLLSKDYSGQSSATETAKREYFFSATYTELAAALSVFYRGQSELLRDFASIYKRMEYNRFGRRVRPPFDMSMNDCTYMIQSVPIFAEKTEQRYADEVRKLKTGDADD